MGLFLGGLFTRPVSIRLRQRTPVAGKMWLSGLMSFSEEYLNKGLIKWEDPANAGSMSSMV